MVELAGVFSSPGDPGRLRLQVALLEAGELCVCDLVRRAERGETVTVTVSGREVDCVPASGVTRPRDALRFVHLG